MSKDSQRSARQNHAAKTKHLWSDKFGVPGFKSNEKTPPIAVANEMASQRLRTMAGRRVEREIATPSVV